MKAPSVIPSPYPLVKVILYQKTPQTLYISSDKMEYLGITAQYSSPVYGPNLYKTLSLSKFF